MTIAAELPSESPDRVSGSMLLLSLLLAGLAYWLSGRLEFGAGADAEAGRRTLAVTALTAGCWLLRAMPLAAASLLPLVLLPLLGARSVAAVAPAYADPILWLFFGGFVLALAIERCGLHRRFALRVIAAFGGEPRRIVLGFALAAVGLSMWINNTATCLALLPIGWAIVERVGAARLLPPDAQRRFGTALMLAIGYSCSIGGIATPIGTAPNLLFFKVWRDLEQQGAPVVSFVQWIVAFAPLAVLFAVLVQLLLVRVLFPLPKLGTEASRQLVASVTELPPMSSAERRVLCVFATVVALWITRSDVRLSAELQIDGWATRLGLPRIDDGTVALGAALLLFLLPAGGGERRPLMDWGTARRMPFEILLLLGGGVAIASAFTATGVSAALGGVMADALQGVSPWLAVAIVVTFLTFVTEVTSNTAITALSLPLLLSTAVGLGIDPRLLLLPATIAASCAFMFPIATPPNAVVFASGKVSMADMARAGLVCNLLSILLLSVVMWLWVLPWLGVGTGRPAWLR